MSIAFISISYNLYLRFYGIVPGKVAEYMFYYAVIWYAPKFLISPVLILNSLHKYLGAKINRKPKNLSKTEYFCIRQRKSFIRETGWLISFVPYIIIIHSFIATTYNFEVKEIDIHIAKNAPELNNLRIVHISDLHGGSFSGPDKFETAVEKINGLNPDIIVITGDFVNFHPVEMSLLKEGLKTLKARYGIYGCLGNHDHYMYPADHQELIKTLEYCGVNILINENAFIGIGSCSLQIAGLDNESYRHSFGDFNQAFDGLKNEFPTILLLHDPYIWASRIVPIGLIDLTLGGHTHGGQMVLNIAGETYSHMRLRYIHWRGYYNENGHKLYLTSGIGTVGIPFRFGVRPEITLINLKTI